MVNVDSVVKKEASEAFSVTVVVSDRSSTRRPTRAIISTRSTIRNSNHMPSMGRREVVRTAKSLAAQRNGVITLSPR